MQSSKGLAAVILTLTLAAGMALGYSISRVVNPARSHYSATSADYWNRISEDWKLDSDQRHYIDSLLDEQQNKMAILYQPILTELDSVAYIARTISDSTQQAMRKVLTEEQRAKLDILRNEARKKADERIARRPDFWRRVQ